MRSAIAIFLKAPMRNSCTPTCTRTQFQRFGRRVCLRKSPARTIGPATRCGKNRMNSRNRGRLFWLDLPPVDVHRVADGLERVERDAERDEDRQGIHLLVARLHAELAHPVVEFVQEEPAVLEVAQD